MAEERIEIPLVLENVLRYSIKDARERMEAGEQLQPFSALAVGETLFMEEHAFDTPDECFASARQTVSNARGAAAYGVCYDGFVETSMGNRDAIIAQGGVPGAEYGHAIGLLYTQKDDGTYNFQDEPIYIGSCLNYMDSLIDDEPDEADADEGAATDAEPNASESA